MNRTVKRQIKKNNATQKNKKCKSNNNVKYKSCKSKMYKSIYGGRYTSNIFI